MKSFQLPKDFLMGSATAATQIEGGHTGSNWCRWCEEGHIKDGSSCIRANDHWNRYAEDVEWMRKLNHRVYRMGLEWSRIEPEKGNFDKSAINHYRDEISLLLKNNIKPLVTLHHFSHPLWFCEEGEFENEKSVSYFERYVSFVVENLGDLVSEYITINEPNVYAVMGYYFALWPPGKKDIKLLLRVYRNMTLCHIAAYRAIHRIRREKGFEGKTMVGVANHLRVFVPYNKNPVNYVSAKIMDYLFQGAITRMMSYGRLLSFGRHRKKYYDFIGINYYTRSAVKGFSDKTLPGRPVNDLGWEIYPEGLYLLCRKYHRKYKAPVWITENGTCDEKDEFRAMFIYDHLYQVYRLINDGIPVERYYHWTLMDNFEWIEGESARFGLIHVDFETQKRTMRKSGEFYSQICRENLVSEELIRKYLG